MFNDMMNISCGRRMAFLAGGHVAVLPAAAARGDRIAAFHGGHCLYLIRPLPHREDAYTFIGECYVDGLMDGACLEVCKQDDKPARLLRLV